MISRILNYLLEGSLKKQAEVLGLQQCTQQMKYSSIDSIRQCVVRGVSKAAGTDFNQQQGEVKYMSIGTQQCSF